MPSVGNEVVYERRFGARNQIEAVVPVDAAKSDDGVADAGSATSRSPFAGRCSPAIEAERLRRPAAK